MSPGHRQNPGNTNSFNYNNNSFNNIVSFITEIDDEDVKFCSGYRHLNHSNATKMCGQTNSTAWGTGC